MPKPISQEVAENYFKSKGCILLDKYIGRNYRVKYKCVCGNIATITWDHFRHGRRCKNCSINKLRKKLSFDFVYVKEFFANQGCELLSNIYVNAMTVMPYRCLCGNLSKIRFSSFKRGSRCQKCKVEKNTKRIRLDPKYIENYFNTHGCVLIEKYTNSEIPLKYKCSCGGVGSTTISNFRNGVRCRECARQKSLHKYSYVKQFFENNGCELLTNVYINNTTVMPYRCSCGNVSKISFQSFQSGTRCKQCLNNRLAELKKFDITYVRNYFLQHNCELLESKYTKCGVPLRYKCQCGNISKICFNSFVRGSRCQECKKKKLSGPNCNFWNPDREAVRLNRIFKCRCSSLLRGSLKATGWKKTSKTQLLLGYSVYDLKNHITTHPNWSKVKNEKWEIDHILPVVAFIKNGIYDLKIINSLDNLRPITRKENIKKGGYYNKDEFIKYIHGKGIRVVSHLNVV